MRSQSASLNAQCPQDAAPCRGHGFIQPVLPGDYTKEKGVWCFKGGRTAEEMLMAGGLEPDHL